MNTQKLLKQLKKKIEGDVLFDFSTKLQFATDASAYREIPAGVVFPKTKEDLKYLISFAHKHKLPLIPRAAGTSLAGQVVGKGLVVDISKYFNKIIEINEKERWVKVQPGVVLDELNKVVEPMGLFFGPETSTSNRCMIGGMIGNNSCGAHSILFGSTRDHLLEVNALLSNGEEVIFDALTKDAFEDKCLINGMEGIIYRNIKEILGDTAHQQEIRKEYPHPSLERRNTGYAIDVLLESEPFTAGKPLFNFCKLIAGSEGTLAFITEAKLNLVPLPPKTKGLICVHLNTIEESFKANLIALKFNPDSVELMDKTIMDLARENSTQRKNSFFIEGDPGAILFIEYAKETKAEIESLAIEIEKAFRAAGYGYHFPVLYGADIPKVWAFRKAGLGVLSNIPGDAKPVAVIEDTAVSPEFLPDYMADFNLMLKKYSLECVYYAHIATGELHLRPILNLKDPADVELFHTVALETAKLVKKYHGSLSGEHGDGRLRGEFIPMMIGEKNYELLKQIKQSWDPEHIFNPGKIVDTPPMNTYLRFEPGKKTREFNTIFDFSKDEGFVRSVERCNGSADCRKSHLMGGTMCPSYMATHDEKNTTRARANVLREFMTHSTKRNPLDHKEIYEIMDLCLSCKACKSECPSNVDMAKLKAEFLQHYYDVNGIPLRSWLIAHINSIYRLGSFFPKITNFLMAKSRISPYLMKMLGFTTNRKMPLLTGMNLKKSMDEFCGNLGSVKQSGKKVYLFADEFIRFNDTEIGIKAVKLLSLLGYEVVIPRHGLSGRTFLSKGLLRKARKIANKNIGYLKDIISEETPLVGLEPSAILSFRDEYPELVKATLREDAKRISKHTLLIEEFIVNEFLNGNIPVEAFTNEAASILLHGHCQQRAVASIDATMKMLSIPAHYQVKDIKAGCCGMAGAFGYEKEHYEISMKVGGLVLFPTVKEASAETIIAASGTSCRHQIKDGTGRVALHPIEILYEALVRKS